MIDTKHLAEKIYWQFYHLFADIDALDIADKETEDWLHTTAVKLVKKTLDGVFK